MIKFTAEQKTFTVSGVDVGGQPGQRPTLLIGSIFFSGHKIVKDNIKGIFDKDKARALLDRDAEASERTGNPRFIDVIGDTGPALINYLEFVAQHTDAPMLVDSFSQKVRLEAVRHFAGTEIAPRLVYNSIAEDYTDEELDCLRSCGVKSTIIMAFSTTAPKPSQRLKLLVNELLPAAQRAGIENILVDPGVLDIASISWTALTIRDIKETLGYPSGCAPSNALFTWEKLRALGQPAFEAAAAATFTLTQAAGADFVHYGPVRNAPWVYQAVATADAMTAYAGRITGIRPVTETHPLYRIF
ncbi:MAG: tetrahydromethanopterin S-methyltransferase subunit H [Anaerolineaceae bacterium]|nr:tetrahydromethanopterin S-methyltransferase subunit H [Anaerolineaceae bacterium]